MNRPKKTAQAVRLGFAVLPVLVVATMLAVLQAAPAHACSCVAPGIETIELSAGAVVGVVEAETFVGEPNSGQQLTVYTVSVELDAFDNVDDEVYVGVPDDSCSVELPLGVAVGLTLNPDSFGAVTTGSCSVLDPETVAEFVALRDAGEVRVPDDPYPIGGGLSPGDWAEAVGIASEGLSITNGAPRAIPIPVPPQPFPTPPPPFPAGEVPALEAPDVVIRDRVPVEVLPPVLGDGRVVANGSSSSGGSALAWWIGGLGAVAVIGLAAAAFVLDRRLRAQGR